ncbi:hypothetical protein H3V53_37070 [Paraburkholderia bengalensis]|uniref:Uncharacterized protein n=1 Tax=Paraburkholderia bengalensis TaxID=2747562 RepID=A0ABU8J4S2_9BURK
MVVLIAIAFGCFSPISEIRRSLTVARRCASRHLPKSDPLPTLAHEAGNGSRAFGFGH